MALWAQAYVTPGGAGATNSGVRAAGIAVAIALLAGAFLLGRKLERDAATQNANAARSEADRAAGEAAAALEHTLALFQLKAQGAAANTAIRSLVTVDEATIHDSLTTEEWSAPYRDRAGAAALFFGETKAGASPTMLDDASLRGVAVRAQADGEASAFVPRQGVYLVAAARLAVGAPDGRKAAIVLSRPVGQDELDALGGDRVLVTDGKQRLASHGDVAAMSSLPGRESEKTVVLANGVAAVRKTGALWVWSLQPVRAAIEPAVPPHALWALGLVLAIGTVTVTLLAGRRREGAPSSGTQAFTPAPSSRATGVPSVAPIPLDDALDTTSPSQGGRSRYIEVAPLGEGGMARVSIAVTHGAEGFRRAFVVKRLKTELTVNPELVRQFIDEARLGASLVHSNVVPVFDFGRDTEGYFMAQEYIMGRDVDAVRRALFEKHRATMDVSLTLYLAQEALKALSYAHGKTDDSGKHLGLVHRDVSPNNLMVSARGEVKLLDFGIVKAEGKLSHTQTGMIKGNVFYMSPEQARGLPVDGRSDLFSLGLVLFTACSGETLYRGNSNYDLLTRAAEGLSAAEWERVKKLPAPLPELLQRALQFDPKDRFASAEEFARAIPAAQVGSAAAMQQLMEALFKEDFAEERSRFSSSHAVGAPR